MNLRNSPHKHFYEITNYIDTVLLSGKREEKVGLKCKFRHSPLEEKIQRKIRKDLRISQFS
jgi:hypothetical protein